MGLVRFPIEGILGALERLVGVSLRCSFVLVSPVTLHSPVLNHALIRQFSLPHTPSSGQAVAQISVFASEIGGNEGASPLP